MFLEEENTNVRKKKRRLNVDIDEDLFIRLDIFLARKQTYKKDFVPLAIELLLDEMEGGEIVNK